MVTRPLIGMSALKREVHGGNPAPLPSTDAEPGDPPARRSGMKLLPVLAAVSVVAVVVPVSLALRDDGGRSPVSASGPQLWTGTATLLQVAGGPLTLCGGATLLSLPPPDAAAPRWRAWTP